MARKCLEMGPSLVVIVCDYQTVKMPVLVSHQVDEDRKCASCENAIHGKII